MVDKELVNKLSKLTKIKLEEHEIGQFAAKLQNVVDLIDLLQKIDTTGVEPLTSVVDTQLYKRRDVVSDGNIEDQLFANVPGDSASLAKEVKCFVVPKVVE